MKKNNRISLSLLVLILAIFILSAGCASTSSGKSGKSLNPDQVLLTFFENLFHGKMEGSYSMLSSKVQSQTSFIQYSSKTKLGSIGSMGTAEMQKAGLSEAGAKILMNSFWSTIQIKILNTDINNDQATVTFDIWLPTMDQMSADTGMALFSYIGLDKNGAGEEELKQAAIGFWNSIPINKALSNIVVSMVKENGRWKINDGWDSF